MTMIRVLLLSGFASLLALPTAATAGPALASTGKLDSPTFVLPANDGYGVADCLSHGGACAIQVANAWCAAQGYHHASGMKTVAREGTSSRGPAVAVTCDP
ncbi:hypothetical protein FHS82_003415 [Pseudochelatococcus lubricantis]|uniref:Uncharacterized protein n=1 Tax=Pseudochelatococcus lubricantis TaxID=1538102 RepID=A0ABX0V347_9HYPH|nr:hypothetical protein [Pseudochelatococcus lubricantis]NIJ59557.1 hypothetical protein [Pseudochelatococcus lubricantis]